MREDEIKNGIQLICDTSKEMSEEMSKYSNDKNILIDKLNSLHSEDLASLKFEYKSKSGPINSLRKDVLNYLLDGSKLDEQKFKNFTQKHDTGPYSLFTTFRSFFTLNEHKLINEFITQFEDEILERLQLKGKVECKRLDFRGIPYQESEKFWLRIYNNQESQLIRSQFFIEFEDCKIKYGIQRQSDKIYTKGPEVQNSANFDFEALISFLKENKRFILKHEPEDEPKNEPKDEPKENAANFVLVDTKSQSENRVLRDFSRNIILYGPPGTGKTYNTIDRAVEIITGNNNPNHEENKKLFDALREEGQIEFITFHQNYSYEDFIIGIRPDLEEASTLKFRRKEGIFYKICKRAEQNYLQSKNEMKALRPFEEIFSEFIEPLEKEELEIEVKMISGKSSFWITEINPSNLGFRKQSGGTDHTLSIDTIRGLYEEKRKFTSGLRSYYEPLIKELWCRGKQTTTEVPLKRYVLIIDEINRANISKVFGELITLLDEDKRIGRENELRISIPGEEKDFGIPSNLYIIGTMNTADKSIALIDIALRRRFKFIGCFPDYDVVKNESSRKILEHINKKIYGLKNSADFLIGHGYFMDNMETLEVLRNKVIPLLMEYFSGKTDIVMGIFEGSEWLVKYDPEKYVWQIQQ